MLLAVILITQLSSPYVQASQNNEAPQYDTITSEVTEAPDPVQLKMGRQEKWNHQRHTVMTAMAATASDVEEIIAEPEKWDDPEEEYEGDIPIYDDRYPEATPSGIKDASSSNASPSNAGRLASGTYILRYRAIVDGVWKTIYEEEVMKGDDGSPPEVPEREGYTFAGWERGYPYVNVQGSYNVYDYIKADAKELNYSIEKFKPGMSGGHRVLLFTIHTNASYTYPINGNEMSLSESDYHWWRMDSNGTWSNKHGALTIDLWNDTGISVSSGEEAISMVQAYYEYTAPYIMMDDLERSFEDLGLDIELSRKDIKDVDTEVRLVGCYYIKGSQ